MLTMKNLGRGHNSSLVLNEKSTPEQVYQLGG